MAYKRRLGWVSKELHSGNLILLKHCFRLLKNMTYIQQNAFRPHID